uniref:PUL domain-containing protein n=1 Tax=Strombidium rassoulzadegani TaxID=1082188 RepID=A0A7S3CJK8_9SPIT|mmetsp:Transcript_13321/g.22630  ORF Transcript_13321/g.22630 Transcript_13321/m.22630 type:complete len:213 (+) Transcript_13321:1342-1980(+)
MVEIAEDRSKIALIDLVRLLLQFENKAVHILRKHWETFNICINQYLMCLDIKNASEKVVHNYHLVSLKMLGNIYQTGEGIEFISDTDVASEVIQFCEYSITSANPKSRFTAAVVLFNHVLTCKRDISLINPYLLNFVKCVIENVASLSGDSESMIAILLAENRILYKNQDILDSVLEMKEKFVKAHKEIAASSSDKNVKEAVADLLSQIGEK